MDNQLSSVDLESLCERCNGEGETERRTGFEICPDCNGAGFVPTPAGEKIIDLMRHNFRPMLRNAMRT
jgi:DnaJ-class molecular chaperone